MGGMSADQFVGLGPQHRLMIIADAHVQFVDEHGVTSGYCVDCDQAWPCPTYRWAKYPGLTLNCSWDLDECAMHQHEHLR